MVKNVLKKNEKRRKNNKGFSLVELIVVIAIMAVLVGILAPQFIKYVERSRQSTDLQNIQQLKSAVEAECADDEDIATISITVTGGTTKTAVVDHDLSASAKEITLKSSGWPAAANTYTYTAATGTWSYTAGKDINGKDPARDMDEIFK